MALGAFLAGVLLASSEYRHALETDIEPFKGLLLGLFFISVGMSVDFGLLLSAPGSIAALLAGMAMSAHPTGIASITQGCDADRKGEHCSEHQENAERVDRPGEHS